MASQRAQSLGRPIPVRAVVTAVVVAVLIGAGLAIRAAASDGVPRPDTTLAPGRGATSMGPVPGASATAQPPTPDPAGSVLPGSPVAEPVVVHVVGKVRRPGLVRVPAGGRVADAVAAAGGATAGAALSRLNLARRVVDGEQVLVPGPDDAVPAAPPGAAAGGSGGSAGSAGSGAAGSGAAGSGAAAGPLDLNSATEAQLDALPGVGPVTAGRIVAWRQAHQRFRRVEELTEVDGIGPATLARLRPLVRV